MTTFPLLAIDTSFGRLYKPEKKKGSGIVKNPHAKPAEYEDIEEY
jgi:hypothetical protein